MMSTIISMTRNQAAGSNFQPRNPHTFEFYETAYSIPGAQSEWITLPDTAMSKVVLSFPLGAGSAFLEGTCSPPDAPSGPTEDVTPIWYSLSEVVSETTIIEIRGESAIRVNLVGGTAVISVRC